MAAKYEIKIVKTTRGGGCSAFLLEDGSQIAKLSRPARRDGWREPVRFQWFSERARNRVADLADCLTTEEIVEALGFPC